MSMTHCSCRTGTAAVRWENASHPRHETIHHLLLAGAVEGDGELVAFDMDDVAVAEFLVEHAVADREGRDGAGRFRHELALDGEARARSVGPIARGVRRAIRERVRRAGVAEAAATLAACAAAIPLAAARIA